MSLIETVVVLAVVMLAVSIFGPLVLDSRERVRAAECANNMNWMGKAWLYHESAQTHLPSSGWGWRWTGDPERGFGKSQPGGWAYNAVRFTEYENIATAGAGAQTDELKAAGMKKTHQTPIPNFYCPARRPVRTYPLVRNGFLAHNLIECRTSTQCSVARIDYQANSGNIALGETVGPNGDRSTINPPLPDSRVARPANGVTTQVSETRLAQITDGLSKTMMVGEKYLNADSYTNGNSAADDSSAYVGINRDVNGYTATTSYRVATASFRDEIAQYFPRRDRFGLGLNWTFGSAHATGFNVVHCDGSVRFLPYAIDHRVFFLLGGRSDGAIPLPP